MLRVDPSMMHIRPPVLPSPCVLYISDLLLPLQQSFIHYFSPFLSCRDELIHTLHYSYVASIHAFYSFMRYIHPCVASHSFISFHLSATSPHTPWPISSSIMYHIHGPIEYLLACIFSLPCIKSNIQLLVKETQADGYKATRLPTQLFGL